MSARPRLWLLGAALALALLAACGGGGESVSAGPIGGGPSGEAGCVEVRFAAPPRDQGQTPPRAEVAPGDVPLPDCPDERRP